MQAKGVAREILRDKALSLQELKRLPTLDEEEEEEGQKPPCLQAVEYVPT
jgi:hypothetical protein